MEYPSESQRNGSNGVMERGGAFVGDQALRSRCMALKLTTWKPWILALTVFPDFNGLNYGIYM